MDSKRRGLMIKQAYGGHDKRGDTAPAHDANERRPEGARGGARMA
jgi:hypothetical protein